VADSTTANSNTILFILINISNSWPFANLHILNLATLDIEAYGRAYAMYAVVARSAWVDM
jgi:hypothetical protein